MIKKLFLLALTVLFIMQGAASAKDEGLPEEERIKIAVEVTDTSRHKELGTAQNLELFLNKKLVEKNLVNIIDTDIFDDEPIIEGNVTAENIGEILVFDAVEMPANTKTPEDFNQTFYKNFGADYVVRCEVLALGATKVEDKTYGILTSVVGGGLSFAGHGSSNRDKTLRRIGDGIGTLGFLGMIDSWKRTALSTVVNMQFISVETGEVVWQQHFTGQAVKHRRPGKDYDDVWTRAYMESVEDTAKLISKRVNKYIDKVIIKGKSDKDFLPKNFSLNKFGGGKLL